MAQIGLSLNVRTRFASTSNTCSIHGAPFPPCGSSNMLSSTPFNFKMMAQTGFVTPLQLPVLKKTEDITSRHSFEKPFIRSHCCRFLSPAVSAGKCEIKTTRIAKLSKGDFFPITSENADDASKPEDEHLIPVKKRGLFKLLNLFGRFSRPIVPIGTLIAMTSISLLPLESTADLSLAFFVGLLKAVVPSMLMNIYVVGLNQVCDVEIDKVNKPDRPLPSGEISMEHGVAIVSIVLFMSFTMGIMSQSPALLSALLLKFLLGSAYSIEAPLLRWKRSAFLSAMYVVTERSIIVQLAAFIHIQKYVLGRQLVFTKSLVFAIAFMGLFSTVLALFKDIPDVDGDRDHGIQTLSVILGQKKVFWLCISMLLSAYGAAMVIGASSSLLTSKLVIVLGHCALASVLWLRARSVDLASNTSIESFYMFLWKLYYAEYLLIPFVR